MAWLDDRAWCHPKLVNLSDKAWRVYFSGVAYSSGMGTKGVLSVQQQRMLGSNGLVRSRLVSAGLWDDLEGGSVAIHDWELHNGKRDARRERDRERKRAERAVSPKERPQDSPQDARQERRALKEVKVVKREPNGSLESGQRVRNPIWDALNEVFGEPTTDTARSLRGKVCSSLTRAGATPEEIISRAKSWPRHFEHATLTETALEKHWDALGRRPLRLEQR